MKRLSLILFLCFFSAGFITAEKDIELNINEKKSIIVDGVSPLKDWRIVSYPSFIKITGNKLLNSQREIIIRAAESGSGKMKLEYIFTNEPHTAIEIRTFNIYVNGENGVKREEKNDIPRTGLKSLPEDLPALDSLTLPPTPRPRQTPALDPPSVSVSQTAEELPSKIKYIPVKTASGINYIPAGEAYGKFDVAQTLQEKAFYDKAIEEYEKLLNYYFPGGLNEKIRLNITKSNFNLNNYENVLNQTAAFIEEYPESAYVNEIRLLRALAYFKQKNHIDSLTELLYLKSAAAKTDEIYWEALLKTAENYFELKKYDESLEILKKAEAENPPDNYKGRYNYEIARHFDFVIVKRDYYKAIEYYEKAYKLSAEDKIKNDSRQRIKRIRERYL